MEVVVRLATHRSDTAIALEAAVAVARAFFLVPTSLDAFHSTQPVMFLELGFVIALALHHCDLQRPSLVTFFA
jgi:hypothetical protein